MNDQELEQLITSCFAADPRGAGIDSLCSLVGDAVSRRTIQRRIDTMLRLGTIERFGKARATRYRLSSKGHSLWASMRPSIDTSRLREDPPHDRLGPAHDRLVHQASDTLPAGATPVSGPVFSTEAKQLRDIMRQQYSLRSPCGYRREFLESYQPNHTEYLPKTMRMHLHALGQSAPMAELPPGTYARQVLDRLIIDLSWNSSRLEGSTYSLLETDHLLNLGRTDDVVRQKEAQMVLNHKAAIEFLVEEPNELGFNRYTFLNLHAILTEHLLTEFTDEGALRTKPVSITGTVYHPVNQPAVIKECFDLILRKAGAISDPLECAFFLMVHMPYLQPFEDGNKRLSRLAANIPLIKNNMSPLSFVDVAVRDYTDGILAVYELNRIEHLRDVFAFAYERSASRYANIRDVVREPDPMRLRYRMEIKDRVRDVVLQRMSKPTAARFLRQWATQNITASDRDHFIEIVEGRLLALTEGSIVRVRVRPSEFHAWWPVWTGG